MRGIACGLLLATLAGACAPPPGALARHAPVLAEHRAEGALLRYEAGMDRATAERVREQLRGREPAVRGSVAVYRVPGRPDRVLAVASSEETPDDYGLRFLLLDVRDGAVRELDRTRGQGDSEWLEPTFYRDGGCVLVFGDVGADYGWGMEVFRLCGDAFEFLGSLHAAPSQGAPDPLPRVRRTGGGYVVEFRTPLVHWTDPHGDGRMQDTVIPYRGRPIRFEWTGTGFTLLPRTP